MNDTPLVSVIIPAYNAEAFIAQAVHSVLDQTYPHFEVIVVDDGSQDDTAPIVEEIAQRDARVKLLRQSNLGVANARNLAIEYSCGEFVAPLDADDLWMPEKLERQVEAMIAGGPQVGLVYCWWTHIAEDGKFLGFGTQWNIEGRVLEALTYCNFIASASVPLFRRSSLEQVGGYNPVLREKRAQGCEDWDLTLRVAEHYEVHCVQSYLCSYRNVAGSMSKSSTIMARSHALVMKDLRKRQPQLSPALFRWSRSVLLNWLTGVSYHNGNYRESLKLSLELIATDLAALTSPPIVAILGRSFVWLLAKPFTRFWWKRHEDYIQFRQRWTHSRALSVNDVSTLYAEAERYPFIWRPVFWRYYDRVCAWRWEQVTSSTLSFELVKQPQTTPHDN